MDALGIITGVLNGGLLGIFGNVATAWIRREDRKLELQQQKQEHEFELAKMERMASIDLAKLEAARQAESERADGAARLAAQQAEDMDGIGANVRPWRWAVSTRIVWRQLLCVLLLILTAAIFWSLELASPSRDVIATSVVTCTTSAVLFFYGERLREKLATIRLTPSKPAK